MYTEIIKEQFKLSGIDATFVAIHENEIRDIYEFSVPGNTKAHLLLEMEDELRKCIPEVCVSVKFPLSIVSKTIGVVVYKHDCKKLLITDN